MITKTEWDCGKFCDEHDIEWEGELNDEQNAAMQRSWENWHDGIDDEIMPAPNMGFIKGFSYGWLAARCDFSQWNQIDYSDPSTYPSEHRPCIVAWENHPDHPDRHAMHVFNDVGDDMRLWQNAIGDEVHDWDGTDENPTHWRYAPEYQP